MFMPGTWYLFGNKENGCWWYGDGGFDGRRGYIYHLAVHPSTRSGLWKGFLEKAITELENQGPEIHLTVFNTIIEP